jgi:hypothetical protein
MATQAPPPSRPSEDEILKRMLNTLPAPHVKKKPDAKPAGKKKPA